MTKPRTVTSTAKRKPRQMWGVFIPMWDRKYADKLYQHIRKGDQLPRSLGDIATVLEVSEIFCPRALPPKRPPPPASEA